MKWLKHILVVVALMVMAMPCCHAAHYDMHGHTAPDASAEVCASHTCHCHSCDDTACGEDFEMPQELNLVSVSAASPTSTFQLFVFTETKRVSKPALSTVSGVLALIQTVQLLI